MGHRNAMAAFYSDRPAYAAPDDWRPIFDAAQSLFRRDTQARFLDLGCHNGDKTLALGAAIGTAQLIGVDYPGPNLRRAAARGIRAVAVDLNQGEALPFVAASFDCIHAGELLEHLFSPDALLTEIRRLLQPHGYAVLTTPNLASWRNRLVLLLGWQPFLTEVSTQTRVGNPRTGPGLVVGHIRVFTPRALVELLHYHGLVVEQLGGYSAGRASSPMTRLFAIIDRLAERYFPRLCDGMTVRVRRSGA